MSEYLMQGETLSAVSDKVRYYIGGIAPEGLSGDLIALKNTVTVYYREFIDVDDQGYEGITEGGDGDTFIAFAYLQNNEGVTVPVLYDTDIEEYPDEADTSGPFFYEGTAEIDGVVYDKWRKIELEDLNGFDWDSTSKQYVYTNVIVGISPTELPSKIDDVYNKGNTEGYSNGHSAGLTEGYNNGYSAGYAEGEASVTGNPGLYGTYMLNPNASYKGASGVSRTISLQNKTVYAYFFNGTSYVYAKVGKIVLYKTYVIIESADATLSIRYDATDGWSAVSETGETLIFPDNQYRVIDFKTKVETSQDIYNLFMTLVDCNGDATPVDVGKKIGTDEFWESFQDYGNRASYRYAFSESGCEYIRPKYKIIPTAAYGVASMFNNATKLKKIEAKYFDFSKVGYTAASAAGLSYTFASCTSLEEIEDIGLGIATMYAYDYAFAWCNKLHTIAKITFNEGVLIRHTFDSLPVLQNLTIDGTIGQNGLDLRWSHNLNQPSILSVISHLSTTTTGLSVTLSKTAVNKAFETSEGAKDGNASQLWLALITSRPNWTINLV